MTYIQKFIIDDLIMHIDGFFVNFTKWNKVQIFRVQQQHACNVHEKGFYYEQRLAWLKI